MNEMSEELATVVAIEGDHAWVECERRSACSGCQQQSNCGTGTVAKAFPLKAPRLRVRLTAEVRVGQQVRLGIPQESLLRGAALVYVLPLFCLLAGALLGQLWLARCSRAGRELPFSAACWGACWAFYWFVTFPTAWIRGVTARRCSALSSLSASSPD